ncbi:hypothetical protein Pcinc_020717 [Petrolisthes cinctipes]|uniref:Uncharacterized protein n=1 Tax=Petrolisthes cinctipes TaxID=88211 RepID=A0AAE1KIP9_PETCI|nr:hypothetical protein Pcinc_020717 [Petrolisthes cinctipes]
MQGAATHLQYITSKASRNESCGMILIVFPVLRRKKRMGMDILHLLKEEDGHGRLQFRRGWAWSSTVSKRMGMVVYSFVEDGHGHQRNIILALVALNLEDGKLWHNRGLHSCTEKRRRMGMVVFSLLREGRECTWLSSVYREERRG